MTAAGRYASATGLIHKHDSRDSYTTMLGRQTTNHEWRVLMVVRSGEIVDITHPGNPFAYLCVNHPTEVVSYQEVVDAITELLM